MKSSVGRAVLLLALVGAANAHAQEVPRPPRPPRPPMVLEPGRVLSVRPPSAFGFGFLGVESVLRQKTELGLNDQQVAQLEAVRKEEVARRQNDSRDLIDLESRYQAGLIDRDAWRDEMERRSDTRTTAARTLRNRIETILTAEQRERLETHRYRLDSRELVERLQLERAEGALRRIPREPFFDRLPELEHLRRQEDRIRLLPFERLRELGPRLDHFRWERRGIL
jgi:Spy/CpxP family protein refolding chaperone